MPMMKKEELYAQADRLGIRFEEGMSYVEKNALVANALKRERLEAPDKDAEIAALRKELARLRAEKQLADVSPKAKPSADGTPIPAGRVILSPEIKPTSVQLFKYDEELGEDVAVEEVSYRDEFGRVMQTDHDLKTGTYRVKGKSGRKVVAQSTIPKENAGVSYDPQRDLVPVVTWRGRRGYIWTHQHYPNVKELLRASGYYHDYADVFSADEHPENIWYAAGKMLVCSISMTHRVFSEIEKKEAKVEGD